MLHLDAYGMIFDPQTKDVAKRWTFYAQPIPPNFADLLPKTGSQPASPTFADRWAQNVPDKWQQADPVQTWLHERVERPRIVSQSGTWLNDKVHRWLEQRQKRGQCGLFPRFKLLEHDEFPGRLQGIHAIILHQTDSQDIIQVFDSYNRQTPLPDGSHFVIDKDGTIYQTASLYHEVPHIGFIKARCSVTNSCTDEDRKAARKRDETFKKRKEASAKEKAKNPFWKPDPKQKTPRELRNEELNDYEKAKPYPVRFPANLDSIGIEIVGKAYNPDGSVPASAAERDKAIYERVNAQQNRSLGWLVTELKQTLGKPTIEILRHPSVSYKNATEASTADPRDDPMNLRYSNLSTAGRWW